ncbi:hypothetical protein AALB39_06585 [Lachnospiraceae bacterium 54-53]
MKCSSSCFMIRMTVGIPYVMAPARIQGPYRLLLTIAVRNVL